MFSNLTLAQKIAMGLVLLSAMAGGTSQLAPIMGQGAAAAVAGLAALGGTVLSGWMFIITGQQGLVSQVQNTVGGNDVLARAAISAPGGQDAITRAVLSLPGVEKIDVNKQANAELAKLAVDPNVDKIAPTPEAINVVTQTAASKP